jgi:hypothetical protein
VIGRVQRISRGAESAEVRRGKRAPPPVFYEKSLEVAENKEWKLEKESQERQRGCKLLKTLNEGRGEKRNTESTEVGARRSQRVHPGAIQMVIKTKGLREKQFVRL